MKKFLILLIYPIALTFASVAYSAGATATFEASPGSGIPFFITQDYSNLKDMKLLERKTNETKMNEYDSALKYGYLKSKGDKKQKSKKSKKDRRSLNYFAFNYTFDVSHIKNLNMISKMSYKPNPNRALYLIGINNTTGAQAVFKVNSLNINNDKLVANVFCSARYSESNPSLNKVSDKYKKQLKELSVNVQKKGQATRNDTFNYVRVLNQGCFFSVKDKNKVSFSWIESDKIPSKMKKILSGPQYSK